MGWREQGKVQFPVRVHRRVIDWIRAKAKAEDVSMNEIANRVLWEAMVRDEMAQAADQIQPERTLNDLRRQLQGPGHGPST